MIGLRYLVVEEEDRQTMPWTDQISPYLERADSFDEEDLGVKYVMSQLKVVAAAENLEALNLQ